MRLSLVEAQMSKHCLLFWCHSFRSLCVCRYSFPTKPGPTVVMHASGNFRRSGWCRTWLLLLLWFVLLSCSTIGVVFPPCKLWPDHLKLF